MLSVDLVMPEDLGGFRISPGHFHVDAGHLVAK